MAISDTIDAENPGIPPYGSIPQDIPLPHGATAPRHLLSTISGDSADETAPLMKGVSVRDLPGEATIASEIVNMTKNLIGCGVLSLSGGIAMFSDSPSAWWATTFWIAVLAALYGYFCLVIAKVCKLTKSVTYRECWENSMGRRGALLVSFIYAVKPAMANLAYTTILSQTLVSLLQSGGVEISRIEALVITTVVGILPLCLLKNIRVLAPFSAFGTAGSILTAVAMCIRYVDGSYRPGGCYYNDIPVKPAFGERNTAWSLSALPFVCMLFEAYVMHYNSPRFYAELKDPTIPRFTQVVTISFGFSAIVNLAVAMAGFLTFGSNSDGYILNNYSPQDPLATVCRIAIATSTLLTYPIVFIGFRDGMLDLLSIPIEWQTSMNINVLSVILVTVITLIATVVTDLGIINAVGGGTFASMICLVLPTLMYHKALNDTHGVPANISTKEDQEWSIQPRQSSSRQRCCGGYFLEITMTYVLMILGTVLGLLGVMQTFSPSSV